MSDTNWTKREWIVIEANLPFDPGKVYTVKGPPSDFMYLTNKADADLIAAAPELYDALEELVNVLGDDSPDKSVFVQIAQEGRASTKAKAALAKARGEKQ